MDTELPDTPRKGRGAVTNRTGRFEASSRHRIDDGWFPDAAPTPLRTTLAKDTSRSIIARNQSPDVPFNQSINPYRGCEHGCVYCFARPTHAYLGLSPGLDFETRLTYKPDAAQLLTRELGRRGYQPSVIAMGTNTDPYQPVERRLRLTRAIIEVLAAHNHPLSIVTKSALVMRDLDLLGPMAGRGLVQVSVSVTTLDRGIARTLEPRAATPARRLETIAALAAAGVPSGVMVAPIIPALTDHELEAILEAASAAGADSAGYVLLRLPLEIKDLFVEWLEAHQPGRARHVMSLMREMRGGKDYQSAFGARMRGGGEHARLLDARFHAACRRFGLNHRDIALDHSQFQRPRVKDDQLSLF